jgi:integrase
VARRWCGKAGLDYSRFGTHSLPAGMVTQAIRSGASDHAIMARTGHKSSDTESAMRRTDRRAAGAVTTTFGSGSV